MQPTSADRHDLDRKHGTWIPPPGTYTGTRLHLVVDPTLLAAGRTRHPSSFVETASCLDCGFTPPSPEDAAPALRRLPSAWDAALRERPHLFDRAAFLRDEIHAVTNRIARLRTAPGSRLSRVTITVPTAIAVAPSRAAVVSLLRISVERLTRLVESLRPADWDVRGDIEGGETTIAELIRLPLHHSHRDLARNSDVEDRAVVVPLDRQRRAVAATRVLGGAS